MFKWIRKHKLEYKTASKVSSKLTFFELRSYQEYNCHINQEAKLIKEILLFEDKLVRKNQKVFEFYGYCFVCGRFVQLVVDFKYGAKKNDGLLIPNWRERLVCPRCGLNNRMRAAVHIFKELCDINEGRHIYITEQKTPLYRYFRRNYENVQGSEYLGGKKIYGKRTRGIRNENLTCLSFEDNRFHCLLSFDVFEHIPNWKIALSECLRCLKPGGILLFTVPFNKDAPKTLTRAKIDRTGKTVYLLPPEYHGDPVRRKGCLSYYVFGWELLDDLTNIGFSNVRAILYWSKEFGYLGGNQVIFAAQKPQ